MSMALLALMGTVAIFFYRINSDTIAKFEKVLLARR